MSALENFRKIGILPHVAGLLCSIISVSGVNQLMSSYKNKFENYYSSEKINKEYLIGNRRNLQDIPVLMHIAANRAMDVNSDVISGYKIENICKTVNDVSYFQPLDEQKFSLAKVVSVDRKLTASVAAEESDGLRKICTDWRLNRVKSTNLLVVSRTMLLTIDKNGNQIRAVKPDVVGISR